MSTFLQKYGPTALVTGSSSGIGEEYSRVLASKGFNLVITARRQSRLETLKRDLEQKHANIKIQIIVADLTKIEDVERILEETKDVDIGLLINNAGMEQFGPFLEDDIERHLKVVTVNVQAPMRLTYGVGKRLVQRKKGGIIFVSSLGAHPFPYNSVYSASKAFLTNFANIIEYEFKKSNVDVLAMEPGSIPTEMSERVRQIADVDMPLNTPNEAVMETLPMLGNAVVFIPGFWNRVMMFVIKFLPRNFMFYMVGAKMEILMEEGKKKRLA